MSEVVTARTVVTAIRRLGFDQWRVRVVTDAGRVLFESTRWSEAQARTDAARWIVQHQPGA